jgi:hypothetical protein
MTGAIISLAITTGTVAVVVAAFVVVDRIGAGIARRLRP